MARIKITKREFERALGPTLSKKMDLAAEELTTIVKRSISRRSSRGSGPSQPGQPPHANTRRLANSIMWSRLPKSHDRIVGTSVDYGLYLEMGATITPTSAGALTIPISKQAKKHLGSARDFPKQLDLISRTSGPPLLIEKKSDAVWIIHYVLKNRVRIEARPYLRPALMSERFRTRLRRIMKR